MLASKHISVLLKEVLDALRPKNGGVYIDGTFGGGGYSKGILEAADCVVWGIDCDPFAQEFGRSLATQFPRRISVLSGTYSNMGKLLEEYGVNKVDGVTLDLGISSMQIDEPSRGFSFKVDGPLDMRMRNQGETAATLVNEASEEQLANIIYRYGEERASRRIAKEIIKNRNKSPITRTRELATIVRRVVNKSRDGLDPATRTFQALRIYINDELGELEKGLNAAEKLLAPGGRIAVVSFHSLEDRRVKKLFKDRSESRSNPSRYLPQMSETKSSSTFRLVRRGVVRPSSREILDNPRARSAKLRVAERTSVPSQVAA